MQKPDYSILHKPKDFDEPYLSYQGHFRGRYMLAIQDMLSDISAMWQKMGYTKPSFKAVLKDYLKKASMADDETLRKLYLELLEMINTKTRPAGVTVSAARHHIPVDTMEETKSFDNILSIMEYYDESVASGTPGVLLYQRILKGKKRKMIITRSQIPEIDKFEQDAQSQQIGRFGELAKNAGLPIIEPFHIPPLRPVEVKGKFNLAEDLYEHTKVAFDAGVLEISEVPDLRAHPDIIPSYYPVYVNGMPDQELLDACRTYSLFEDVGVQEIVLSSGRKLAETMNKFYYTNGNVVGQVGRMKAVHDNYVKMFAIRTTKGFRPKTADELKIMFSNRCPVWTHDIAFDKAPSQLMLEHEDEQGVLFKPLVSVNAKSDAGILYSKGIAVKTREETFMTDLDMADWLYHKCGNESLSSTQLKEATKFFRVAKNKPKSEVYVRDDIYKKVRNIFVGSAAANLPAQMILSQSFSQIPNLSQDNLEVDTWNLIGFNPYRGGFDRVIKHFVHNDKARAVYADNAYIVARNGDGGQRLFVSMDGVKNESSVTRTDAVALGKIAVACATKGVDKGWARYLAHIYPDLTCDMIAVMGTVQVSVPYLSSGAIGTAYLNQFASVDYVETMDKMTHGNPVIRKADRTAAKPYYLEMNKGIMEACARNYEIESVVDLDNINSGEELAFDLLGFNGMEMGHMGMSGYFAPLLQRERLYKALAFFKSDLISGKKKGVPSQIVMAIKFFKYRLLYVLGAWADPGLSIVLKVRCASIMKSLRGFQLKQDISEELTALMTSLGMDNFGGEKEFYTFASTGAIPHMLDVMEFLMPSEAINGFLDFVFKHETPWAFMSIERFLAEAVQRNYEKRPQYAVLAEEERPDLYTEKRVDFGTYLDIKKKDPDWSEMYDMIMELPQAGARVKPTLYTGELPTTPAWYMGLGPDEKKNVYELGKNALLNFFTNSTTKPSLYINNANAEPLLFTIKRLARFFRLPQPSVLMAITRAAQKKLITTTEDLDEVTDFDEKDRQRLWNDFNYSELVSLRQKHT